MKAIQTIVAIVMGCGVSFAITVALYLLACFLFAENTLEGQATITFILGPSS